MIKQKIKFQKWMAKKKWKKEKKHSLAQSHTRRESEYEMNAVVPVYRPRMHGYKLWKAHIIPNFYGFIESSTLSVPGMTFRFLSFSYFVKISTFLLMISARYTDIRGRFNFYAERNEMFCVCVRVCVVHREQCPQRFPIHTKGGRRKN